LGDQHRKRRSTEKTVKVIDLKDGKIKLYISINVNNQNQLKNNNTNENESMVTGTITSKVGDDDQVESFTEHDREKKFSKKTLDHNSARHLNLINKQSKSSKRR
jgi:hypothetical protein